MLIGLYWNSEDIYQDFVSAKGEKIILINNFGLLGTVMNWPIFDAHRHLKLIIQTSRGELTLKSNDDITVTGRFPFLVSLILRKGTWFLNELKIVRVFI